MKDIIKHKNILKNILIKKIYTIDNISINNIYKYLD